eukprot:g4180.t1
MSEAEPSSAVVSRSSTMTSGVGTPLYMAPEICKTAKDGAVARYSEKVDVYAFAIVLYETLALKMPWTEFAFSHQILSAVESGDRPAIDPRLKYEAPRQFVALMKRCWAQDPEDRCGFDEIYDTLQDMKVGLYRGTEGGGFGDRSTSSAGGNRKSPPPTIPKKSRGGGRPRPPPKVPRNVLGRHMGRFEVSSAVP